MISSEELKTHRVMKTVKELIEEKNKLNMKNENLNKQETANSDLGAVSN